LWHRAERKIGYWLRGQVILSLFIGIVTWVGLSLLGVRYALLLALIFAMLEIVQVAGPIAAGLAAVTVALVQAPLLAGLVAVFFFIVQQIEGNIIVPILFRRMLGLHPVVVIFALFVGGRLGGVIGLIVAVPIAAVITEFLNDWSKGKVKL
jgi:predicted PurR-regulated permease PerM